MQRLAIISSKWRCPLSTYTRQLHSSSLGDHHPEEQKEQQTQQTHQTHQSQQSQQKQQTQQTRYAKIKMDQAKPRHPLNLLQQELNTVFLDVLFPSPLKQRQDMMTEQPKEARRDHVIQECTRRAWRNHGSIEHAMQLLRPLQGMEP